MKKNLCSVCILIGFIISLTGCSCKYHDLEEEIVKEPTCTINGLKKEYCRKCDYSVEEEISSSHDFQRVQVLEDATCITDGSAIYKCTVCGDTEIRTIYAGHSYSGRTCIECGYKKPLPELSVGMSKSQVKMKWGEPIEIDKSTSSRGTEETWWYKENGKTIAVIFDVDGKVWLISQ